MSALRELKAATLAKLFREGLRGEPLKETEIGEMPESWRVMRLGDPSFATTAAGGTPDRTDPECFGGGIPWVKSGELRDDILEATEETLSEKGLRESSARLVSAGTLLVAMYGATAGLTSILTIPAATNQAVCAISPVGNSFVPEFLRHYLVHSRGRLLGARHGGAQPNLSQQILRGLPVAVPPPYEQEAIAERLVAISSAIRNCEGCRRQRKALFDVVLSALMTGKLRIDKEAPGGSG